jgi:D-xylose transport system substrate-binding protein
MYRSSKRAFGVAGAVVVVLGIVAAGCGGGGGGGGPKIALLLPENKTARYETQDRPLFEKQVKQDCPKCSVLYSNATQDPAKQQSQAEAALTQGAKVLVLDAVDAASADVIVKRANAQKVPVLAYDRLIPNANIDAYVSFDNVRVGKLQGTALTQKLKSLGRTSPTITMINGAPTDNNAKLFKQGALSVFSGSGVKIGKAFDTPDWSPDKAQNEMQQAITALGNNGFQGVYAANDGTAGGAIAAMKSAGIQPATRPTTGQDAELAAVQRILAGEQYMTVYKAVKLEAPAAATISVALSKGQKPPTPPINGTTNNGQKNVPSTILTPVSVTKSNIAGTIVKDGFWTANQICTAAFAAACKANGIA